MGGKICNELLQKYIDSVGQKIARVSHRPDVNYHFTAINHKTINAFAMPGGYVFVTKGMLEKLDSESQLAGVLSHEITHVVARHSAEAISRQTGLQMILITAAASTGSPGAAQAADAARQIIGLQYSKEDERQADLTGMNYMVTAGYDPNGMVETMQMLQHEEQSGPIDFLSSHPSSYSRIAYLSQRIETRYSGLKGLKVGKEDYHREVLARLAKVP